MGSVPSCDCESRPSLSLQPHSVNARSLVPRQRTMKALVFFIVWGAATGASWASVAEEAPGQPGCAVRSLGRRLCLDAAEADFLSRRSVLRRASRSRLVMSTTSSASAARCDSTLSSLVVSRALVTSKRYSVSWPRGCYTAGVPNQIPATTNASATVCGLPMRDRSAPLTLPVYIMFAISLVCVFLRLLAKPGQRNNGFDRLDDWIMVANAVGSIQETRGYFSY